MEYGNAPPMCGQCIEVVFGMLLEYDDARFGEPKNLGAIGDLGQQVGHSSARFADASTLAAI